MSSFKWGNSLLLASSALNELIIFYIFPICLKNEQKKRGGYL